MINFGNIPLGSVLPVFFATYGGTNGQSITTTGLAVTDVEIYKAGSVTQRSSDAGYTLLDTDGIDFDGLTGIHGFSIDTGDNTDASFFVAGSFYTVIVSSVTVDAQTVNFIAATFRLVAAENTAGTPAADVVQISGDSGAADNAEAFFDGTGYAGTNNVIPTVTTTGTATNVTTVNGLAANVITTASIANDAITDAKVAADVTIASVTGAIGSVTGAVGSVTGNVGGNVTGSVGSIATGGIVAASFAAGAIGAAAIATDAIGASELAADAVAEIADAVWDELLSGHAISGSAGEALSAAGSAGDPWTTALPGAYGAGTAGKIVGDNLNATVSSRATQTSVDDLPTNAELSTALGTADDAVLAAINDLPTNAELATALGTADDAVLAAIAGIPAAPTTAQIADKILTRHIGGGSDVSGAQARNVTNALRALRNKQTIIAGTGTVYEEDDSTTAWTYAATETAGDPLSAIDPT